MEENELKESQIEIAYRFGSHALLVINHTLGIEKSVNIEELDDSTSDIIDGLDGSLYLSTEGISFYLSTLKSFEDVEQYFRVKLK